MSVEHTSLFEFGRARAQVSAKSCRHIKEKGHSIAVAPHSRVPFYSCLGGNAKHFRDGEVARSGDGFEPAAGTADSSCLAPLARRNDKKFLHSLVVTSDAVFPLSKPLKFCHSERAGFARRNLLSLRSAHAA
jgi:hypothetical protein